MEQNMKEQVIDKTITLLVNGVYNNLSFKIINDYIIQLNDLKKHLITGDELTEVQNNTIDTILKIIMNGTYSNYSFIMVNDVIINLNSLKKIKTEQENNGTNME